MEIFEHFRISEQHLWNKNGLKTSGTDEKQLETHQPRAHTACGSFFEFYTTYYVQNVRKCPWIRFIWDRYGSKWSEMSGLEVSDGDKDLRNVFLRELPAYVAILFFCIF